MSLFCDPEATLTRIISPRRFPLAFAFSFLGYTHLLWRLVRKVRQRCCDRRSIERDAEKNSCRHDESTA